LLFFLIANSLQLAAFSQYWQQRVDYTIDVTLNDKDHTLDGFEKIEYFNNSPDTLTFIWFHLWPNAYKNDKTAFSDHMLENGNTKFYFSGIEDRGYINRLNFKVNNLSAKTEDHPEHIDITKIVLPVPLPPGQKAIITTPFHVKLPYNFSRGGHDGQSYQATQWYPKPAVLDKNGWHPMPYLDQGEFYSEFGNFDVNITVPRNYVVAATGELQDDPEKEWLKARASFDWQAVKQSTKTKGGGIKTTTQLQPESDKETKTLQYKQDRVHDFAWFADKRFIVDHDTCRLPGGKIIDVYTYYTPAHRKTWKNSLDHAKRATRFYSGLVGEYPYSQVSVVQGPESFGGGMEYPTITVISPGENEKELDNTIAHEIGHNWFYGILGSNERQHAWMDEGINSYYDNLYTVNTYGRRAELGAIIFETKAATRTDQPIELSSEKFSEVNYYSSVYYKTSEWMRWLESQLGTEVFNAAMQEYYRRWQFRHPQPEDLKEVLEQSSGKDLDSAFAFLTKTGLLPSQQRRGITIAFALDVKSLGHYVKSPTKDLVIFGPAIGFNYYDKLMAGLLVTNMKLPPSRLQFLLAPMYATGSKSFTGLGLISYSIYPESIFRKIELSTGASSFTAGRFSYSGGNQLDLKFSKLVPGIRFTFAKNNPRSQFNRFIQFKSFFIREDKLQFYRDTLILPPDTTITDRYRTIKTNRTLNQLKLVIENKRALYPYRGELNIEQGKDFVRAGFTGNYFFNYPKGGGLEARLFAGKFFYTGAKTISREFTTSRYQLNLLAPNGAEDYTYHDYFVGRNEFTGLVSQQIMERDGAMKIRLEQFEGDPEFRGRTLSDNWIAALNISTTLPSGILPKFLPLKVFTDIGTSSGFWKTTNPYGKFAFVSGLQLSFLNNLVNIYLPVLYTSEFRNLLKSDPANNKFGRKISFSINISNFSLQKIDRNFDL
jgi:hypothetical protein